MPSQFGHERNLSSGSDTRPWLSPDADSSNPETLNEIPEGSVSRAFTPKTNATPSRAPRASVDSTMSTNAQRMAELRAEMKTNQEQIERLTHAHQAIRDAVSGIHASQDLLMVTPRQAVNDTAALVNDAAAARTAEMRADERRQAAASPEDEQNEKPKTDKEGWVDEGYYEQNPWYGQKKKKPVYSLGGPLPHRNRFGKGKKNKKGKGKGDQDLEKGEGKKPNNNRQTSDDTLQGGNGEDVDYHEGTGKTRQNNPWDVDFREGMSAGHSAEKAPGYEDGSKYKVDGEPVGQREDDKAEEGGENPDELRNWWARLRNKYPEPLAEFLCTAMSTFLGICATLSINLSSKQENQYGTYETACWAWGFAFMVGIYIGGGISGAHMNPAISICLSIFRGFPWRQCGVYIVIQFIASFTAAALAYAVYYDAIHYVDPEMSSSYSNFFSYPQEWVSNGNAFLTQFVAGGVMTISVFALGDDENNPPGAGMHAVVLGFLQVAMKMSLGYNTGSALNPASDFGPRVLTLAVGYKTPEQFQNAWWIYGPWAAALAGSLAGCVIYDGCIFTGSESPINYRVPESLRKKVRKATKLNKKEEF
ncbi:aquaporin-like protein [Xylariaceae sp. FL1019]|nr:aquaporin-like protein [Xylariaceae sp. FL1019]